MNNNIRVITILFLIILLFYGINNYFIVKNRYAIPLYADEAYHLTTALKYYNVLKNFSLNSFKQLSEIDSLYPPIVFISAAILNVITGFSKLNAVMVNLFFLLIMAISVYCIGKKISNDKNTGLFAVFILSMFPMIFGMSRWFMLDFALTAMVALSISCLIYTDNFTNRKMSLLFGVSLALALLTKWIASAFIIGPFLYIFFMPFSKFKLQFLRRFQNVAYAIIIYLVLVIPWYHYHWSRVFPTAIPVPNLIELWRLSNIRMCEEQFIWNSFRGALYYAKSIFPCQISVFFSLFFIPSLFFFIKSPIRYRPLIFSWALIPYIFFTILDNKWARFIMPVLPAIALIIAVGITQISFRRIRRILIYFVVIVGIAQYFFLSYLAPENVLKVNNAIGRFFFVDKDRYNDYFELDCLGYGDRCYKEKCDLTEEIIKQMAAYSSSIALDRTLNVGIIWPTAVNRFRYLALLRKLNIVMYPFYEEAQSFLNEFDNFDLLILETPTGIWPEEAEIKRGFKKCNLQKRFRIRNEQYIEFAQNLERLSEEFTPVKLFRASHNSFVYLLIKNKYNREEKRINYVENKAILQRGDLRLAFSNGLGRIYCDDLELTEDLGIHILVLSSGRWHASTSKEVVWSFEKIDKNRLIAQGKWLNLPISHTLQFQMENDNTIYCKVDTQVYRDANLEQASFIMMLSDAYGKYLVPNQGIEERFPIRHRKSYEWEDLWHENVRSTPRIGVINGNNHHKIMLDCSLTSADYTLVISNTADRHRARALICNRDDIKRRLSVGSYPLFEGKIKID